MRALLLVTLFLTGCLTTQEKKDFQEKPPAWIPVAGFCAGCAAIPVIIVFGPMLMGPQDKVPGYGAKMDDSPYPGEQVAKLFDVFLEVWEEKFHNSNIGKPMFDRLDILWIESNNWDEGVPFMVDHGRRVAGAMDWVGRDPIISRGRIRVTWGKGFPLHKGALAHELAHGFLYLTTGDADADHLANVESKTWTPEVQWVVDETNRRIGLTVKGP